MPTVRVTVTVEAASVSDAVTAVEAVIGMAETYGVKVWGVRGDEVAEGHPVGDVAHG